MVAWVQIKTKTYLKNLLKLAQKNSEVLYVVGGTLRNQYLKLPFEDYDFTGINAPEIANSFAESLKLPLVKLDDTPNRETFRVVIVKNLFFDFCRLQGCNIEEDLSQRDFSINAMAQPLDQFIQGSSSLIDNYNGLNDLKNKTIRVLSKNSFKEDPLRMLRAVRFTATLNFSIEPETFSQIKSLNKNLQSVANERVTSELLKILGSNNSQFAHLLTSGIATSILPELNDSVFKENQLISSKKEPSPFIQYLEFLEQLLNQPSIYFNRFSNNLSKALTVQNNRYLIKMAGLLTPIELSSTVQKTSIFQVRKSSKILSALKRLKWSNDHQSFIDKTLHFYHYLLKNFETFFMTPLMETQVYQLIKQSGDAFLPSIFLLIADRMTKKNVSSNLKSSTETIMEFYFETFLPRQNQNPLLNGETLINKFHLEPSPKFKIIIDQIEEARVLGKISTKEEAESLARAIINSQ